VLLKYGIPPEVTVPVKVAGMENPVAAFVPVPVTASDAPLPITIAAVVFVLPVRALNAVAADPLQAPALHW
jgi:hypothetical protein